MKRQFTFVLTITIIVTILNSTSSIAQPAKLISLDSLSKTAAVNAVYVAQILYNNQNYITRQDKPLQNAGDIEIIKNTFVQAISYYGGSGDKSITSILQKYPAINTLYVSYFFNSISDSEIYHAVTVVKDLLDEDPNATKIKNIYEKIANNYKTINALHNIKPMVEKAQSLKDSIVVFSSTVRNDSGNTQLNDMQFRLQLLTDNIKKQVPGIENLYIDEGWIKEQLTTCENNTQTYFSELKIEFLQLASDPNKINTLKKIIPGKSEQFRAKVNYFLTSLESNYNIANTSNQVSFFTEYVTNQSAGSSFSMPSQTEMIDAVAVFLAKRAKQEAVLWFFEQLRNKSKINKEINVFFPECMALLNSGEVYEMPEMGKAWRYAIAKDFVKMPANFFKSPFIKDFLSKNDVNSAQLQEYIYYAGYIAELMQKKYNTDAIINNLYMNLKDNYLSNRRITPGHFITLLYVLKQEFYIVNGTNKQWLHPATLMDMPDDVLKTILSLTDMKYSGVFSKLLLPEGEKFDFDAAHLNQVRRLIGKMLQGMQQIQNITAEAKKSGADNADNVEVYNYSIWQFTNSLIADFDEILTITHNPRILDTSQIYTLHTCLFALREILSVYALIDKKNYNNAVNMMFDIVLTLVNNDRQSPKINSILADIQKTLAKGKEDKDKMDYKKLNTLTTRLKHEINKSIDYNLTPDKPFPFLNAYNKRYAGKDDSLTVLSRYLSYDKTRSFILTTTRFLSDVSTAKNSQDLSKVVSAYALPPTSYKLKRNTWNSIFINGYVGVYAGYENLTNTQFKNNTLSDSVKTGWVYGVSAPIGLAFSKTFGGKRKVQPSTMDTKYYPEKPDRRFRDISKNTLTVFISVIDLGAIVSYRFKNTQGTLPQDFKWGQFISPGLHLQYGIPSTPLVFSTGVVYSPQVRKVDAAIASQVQQYNAVRIYGGLFFDIPLITIHSKEKFKGLKVP